MKRWIYIASIDPGTKHLGMVIRPWRCKLIRETGVWALTTKQRGQDTEIVVSGVTAEHTAEQVLDFLATFGQKLPMPLVVAEDFAYSKQFRMTAMASLVGALESWCGMHGINFQRVGIGTIKKRFGVGGRCKKKDYVIALRKKYPKAKNDDVRVALAIQDNCVKDCWTGELFTGGLDAKEN
jgi:hypothetical protein